MIAPTRPERLARPGRSTLPRHATEISGSLGSLPISLSPALLTNRSLTASRAWQVARAPGVPTLAAYARACWRPAGLKAGAAERPPSAYRFSTGFAVRTPSAARIEPPQYGYGKAANQTEGKEIPLNDNQGQEPLLVVAILTIVPGAHNLFREFETRAAHILARHGGSMERTVAVEPSVADGQREVHLLRFPSKDAFARYRADAELASLAELRSASVAHTEVLIGREGPQYSQPSQ